MPIDVGPAEFAVDRLGVERVGLPHLELVDRRAGQKIAAHEPRLLGVPIVGLLRGPAFRLRTLGWPQERQTIATAQERNPVWHDRPYLAGDLVSQNWRLVFTSSVQNSTPAARVVGSGTAIGRKPVK